MEEGCVLCCGDVTVSHTSEPTHLTCWDWDGGSWWPGTKWWDSAGLKLERPAEPHLDQGQVLKTVVCEVLAADLDISPGRLFENLTIGFGKKLHPFQPFLRVLW